jgi:hypothetical protein
MNSAYADDFPHGWRHESDAADLVEPLEVEPPQGVPFLSRTPPFYHVYLNRAGFAYYRNDFDDVYHDHYTIAPFWFITVLLACGPALAIRRRLRRRAARQLSSGRCAHCSYNLTGNVSGACPECGTPSRGPRPVST